MALQTSRNHSYTMNLYNQESTSYTHKIVYDLMNEIKVSMNILSFFYLLFGRGPNRVMETACFDANVQ